MTNMHGTTIVGVRKNRSVTIAGDGQVSLGNTIIKGKGLNVKKNGEYIKIKGKAILRMLLLQKNAY